MTSAITIKDLQTCNPPQANHPSVHLSCVLLICSMCVYICAILQLVHVRSDKRALGVSRGEGLWNMESSRVVLYVTPVL